MASPSVLSRNEDLERPNRAHIPALDGVRGIAVILVFLYHYGGGAHSSHFAIRMVGATIELAWSGVTLFFVLSGFLITGILWDSIGRPFWWRTFYIRRSLRIFPLYYAALLGSFVAAALLGASWSSISPAWSYFFYLQNFPGLVKYGSLSPSISIGHFWSLAVEEQFYLIWPFLLLLAANRGRAVRLCWMVCLASLLFRVSIFAFGLNPRWVVDTLFARCGELAAGAWLALMLRGGDPERRRALRLAAGLLPISLAGIVLLTALSKETQTNYPWMGTIGISLVTTLGLGLIALCLKPGIVSRFFELSVLRWFGKLSYGVYVFHVLLRPAFVWIVHALFPRLTGDSYLVALACVAFPGTLFISALSFVTLESAFLRMKDSLTKTYTVTSAA